MGPRRSRALSLSSWSAALVCHSKGQLARQSSASPLGREDFRPMRSKLLISTIFSFASLGFAQNAMKTLPQGTDIKVVTDTAIPAKPAANAHFTATVNKDIN